MLWNSITSNDVAARFNAPEVAALKAVQASDGDAGLEKVLQDVVNSARGKIKAGNNQLGKDGTIPDSIRREVIALARWDWLAGFSKNEKLQTDARKQQAERAEEVLEKIARGEIKVELPDDGTSDQTAAPMNGIEVASKECRQFTRTKMDGL